MLELTKENYDITVDGSEIVIIDCWQQFCAPCAQFAPIFKKTSEKYPEITFTKLNSQVETSISDHFFISSTPTTVIMKEKTVVFKKPGVFSEEELVEIIDKIKAMDMEEFRAAKAAEKAARRAARQQK
ncbi:thioredoxin family protein [Sulfurimonas sp. HSL-3221]|uniref:thioredoxin family protein n=1 Tax=Sulfurimonadaceae TaxID=2771471 RepID=UPI001E45299B|nr:thioredoxin family protein [Sulfurimonas sp. HSL-3221]UFS61554.1 thioredoxin family protein [Sulfurimonas sp. HSL-3221]